jgi:hypothetical protein
MPKLTAQFNLSLYELGQFVVSYPCPEHSSAAEIEEFAVVEPMPLYRVANVIYVFVSELGWIPLVWVLHAHRRATVAKILLIAGSSYSLLCLCPNLWSLFGTGSYFTTYQWWREQAACLILFPWVGLVPSIVIGAARWRQSSNRSLLLLTILAITLAVMSLSLPLRLLLTPGGLWNVLVFMLDLPSPVFRP